jgi:hypothetical protein
VAQAIGPRLEALQHLGDLRDAGQVELAIERDERRAAAGASSPAARVLAAARGAFTFRRCLVSHRSRVGAAGARIPAAEPRHDAQERVAGPSEPRALAPPARGLAAATGRTGVRHALALVGDLFAPIGGALPNIRETVALIGYDVAALGSRVTGAAAGGHQVTRASAGST